VQVKSYIPFKGLVDEWIGLDELERVDFGEDLVPGLLMV